MWRFYRMTLEMPEIDSKGKIRLYVSFLTSSGYGSSFLARYIFSKWKLAKIIRGGAIAPSFRHWRYVCFYRRYSEACSTSQARRAWSPSLQAKYDPASRMKCNAKLIIDDIQYSRKSCHDKYEFRTVSFTISCWKLHFITRNYNT
jgi:hypothetical protein